MKKYFQDDYNYKQFERVVRSWIGTPYRHLTLVKGRGADCALFVGGVMKGCSLIKDVVYDYYPRDWHIHTKKEYVLEGIHRHINEYAVEGISLERYEPDEVKYFRGDIFTFSMRNNVISNHAAFYMEGGTLIHSINKMGVHEVTMPNFFRDHMTNIFRIMEK